MKTVRITLALAVALSIAMSVMAQEKKAAKGKAAKLSPTARVMLRMGKLRGALEGLDLTAEQKSSGPRPRSRAGRPEKPERKAAT
jgi:Spy/CpxP family protein refolding chaperone